MKPPRTNYLLRFLRRSTLLQRTRPFQYLCCHATSSRYIETTTQRAILGQPFEEETIPGYEPDQFWPIHIRETLNSRYTVVGKLGFGANSTVWLGRDLKDDSFVAVKVYVKTRPAQVYREQVAYARLCALQSSHPGRLSIRPLLDLFSLSHPDGTRHHCLVHPPLHMTMFDLQTFGGQARVFPEDLVKDSLRSLLQAIDFFHTEAGIALCDIKLSNLMLQIKDTSVLAAFANAEQAEPVPRKVVSAERTIYGTRKFRHPRAHAFGPLVLCDFGEARVGTSFPHEEIQPAVYNPPEILLQLQWNSMVDIWNVACITWEMIQCQHLFDGHDEEGYHNNRVHIGEMVSLLGHPPMELQHRSDNSWRVFDEEGQWRGNPPLSLDSLEDRLTHLTGESKSGFVAFLRSMMKWRAEERTTAAQLLDDPWLANQ